jgi:hypothetical protein
LIPTAELEYKQRMKRRDERRLREGWTPEQVERGSRYIYPSTARTRPSDGMPVGSKAFDYEEYLTRKADRKAADPESFQREKAARRRDREAMGQRWREQHDFDNCNAELKQERRERERRYPGNTRLLDIWQWIINAEQAEKIDRIHLRQEDRIANARRLRVKGCGHAARKAGFAD